MSSTSEQASGYQRDPRWAAASMAYHPYAASYCTEGLTALAGWLLILGGCWSFFVAQPGRLPVPPVLPVLVHPGDRRRRLHHLDAGDRPPSAGCLMRRSAGVP
jgi:hypothetical protein